MATVDSARRRAAIPLDGCEFSGAAGGVQRPSQVPAAHAQPGNCQKDTEAS